MEDKMFTLLKNLVVIVFCVVVVVSIWPQFTENIDIVRPYVEQGLSWITESTKDMGVQPCLLYTSDAADE